MRLPLVQPFKSLGILYHQGEESLVYDGRRCIGTAAGCSQGKDISPRHIQWVFLVFLISASGHACFGFFETLPSTHSFTREFAPSSGKRQVEQYTDFLTLVKPEVMMGVVGSFA